MGINKRTARLAGFLWLLMCVFGPIAQVVRSKVFVIGNMEATASNILANESLFRLGFVSDLIMMVIFLFLPLVLYKLLSKVNRDLSVLMVILVVVSVPINMLNLLNEFASLHLLSGAAYLNAFGAGLRMAQAMLSYDLYLHGYEIANVFFSLWLVPLGLLVYRSGFLPRILGALLVAGGCSLLLEVFVHFLLPGATVVNNILLVPQTLSEFAFLLWALTKGIDESKVQVAQTA